MPSLTGGIFLCRHCRYVAIFNRNSSLKFDSQKIDVYSNLLDELKIIFFAVDDEENGFDENVRDK